MDSIIVIAVVVVICLAAYFLRGLEAKTKGILYRTSGEYFGGYNDIEGRKKLNCIISKDKLIITISKIEKTIKISAIKNVSIKSDTQIRSNIVLGRLFNVDIKKQKTKANNYIVIKFNAKENIILNMINNNKFIDTINSCIAKQNIL